MESLLGEDWQRAEIAAGKLADSHERFWSWLGSFNLATTHLCRGQAGKALARLDEAARAYSDAPHLIASARTAIAQVLIDLGRADEALPQARRAMGSVRDGFLGTEAMFLFGLAHLKHRDLETATQVAERLAQDAEPTGAEWAAARGLHLAAEIALSSGSMETAIRDLERALGKLATVSLPGLSAPTPQIPIRFSLATACRISHRADGAIRELGVIVEDRRGLLNWPIAYVRSFYFLGKEQQIRGDVSAARKWFQRFVNLWRGGDLDVQRVAEAERFLQGKSDD